jgi:hypothetical protein
MGSWGSQPTLPTMTLISGQRFIDAGQKVQK